MMFTFPRSSVQSILQPIDCRRLSLSLRFYMLDQTAVACLAEQIIGWVNETAGNGFCFRWEKNRKVFSEKRTMSIPNKPFDHASGLIFAFSAYVKNALVCNAPTMKQYCKKLDVYNYLYTTNNGVRPFTNDSSIDYPDFFDSLFSNERLENSKIIENVHRIFHTEDRKHIAFHLLPDFNGDMSVNEYEFHAGLYYGEANLSLSAFCLDNNLCQMADRLAQFACKLSEAFTRLNIHVSLQPRSIGDASPYMRYFGKHFSGDDSYEEAECLPEEWCQTYYLCGVEWLNILSPLAKQHIKDIPSANQCPNIEIRTLSSGALLVQSRKPITEYALTDALSLKHIVLRALYPGMSAVTLRNIYPWKGYERYYTFCPRNNWAIVPVEKDELSIIGTDLVFRAKSIINGQ